MRSGRPSVVSASSALVGLLACVLASGCAHTPRSENKAREAQDQGPVIADTAQGQVRGATLDGIRVFKGIAYGGPTSGKNRFMPPTRPESWSGVKDALAFGPRCAQRSAIGANVAREVVSALVTPDTKEMSEDCLRLNIWTPNVADGGKRPVMVWLHGGGFVEGSGSAALYDGNALAKRGDAVVVTLNHRLGVLGYLYPGAAAGEAWASSGNAGMLDIVAALQWVRDNIASFGGDPGNVTIFGESGGGMKVTLLLAMPTAQGLFHRAISQSGAMLKGLAPEPAVAQAGEVLAELGLKPGDFAALQELPVDKVLDAQTALLKKNRGSFSFNSPFTPVADGKVLPGHPFDPEAPAISASVPLLIGTNKDEMTLFLYGQTSLMTDGMARMGMGRIAGEAAGPLFDHYRKQLPEASAKEVLMAAGSDMFRAPSLLVAERKAAQQAPVYVYQFNWETPVLEGRLKATHALEIPFVFDNLELMPSLTGRAPERAGLADQMSTAWIAFARSGNPQHPGIPEWPAYDAERRATMIFNLQSEVRNDPGREERLLWREVLTK
ncbi:carboxylesterase/lipase family protein [Cystobacter fuscus]|uniref:carboxylesterase/lipase family protein n=1 Tax=Cystobacter fuscus TaxID=43 RepID=UPI002B312CB9|nr:carboxylesterase/lipase family protein [Cystobacter fuscus]